MISAKATILVEGSRPLKILVPLDPKTDVASSLLDFVAEVVSFEIDDQYVKVICKGKILPLRDVPVGELLPDGVSAVKVVVTDGRNVLRTDSKRSDPTLRGFSNERHTTFSSDAAEQDASYKFCRFEVIDRFTTPHPFEAEKLLKALATDGGVVHVMRKREFVVGTLKEMDIRADRLAQSTAESGACLLGYNENAGHAISLRLRTDDLLAFRSYDSIINTLLHELSHNLVGPHNDDFWRVFADLKKEYLSYHGASTLSSSASRSTGSKTTASLMRKELGNTALSKTEQSSLRRVVDDKASSHSRSAAAPSERAKPYVNHGARMSQHRRDMRDRAARAAEQRRTHQSD